jgi:hypothetical protein
MDSSAPSTTTDSRKKNRLADAVAGELGTDEVAIIFSFLPYYDIMRARVCTTWRDAAKKTLVPLTDFSSEFVVNSVVKYNAMRVMSTALPNLQQLSICGLGHGHKYIDGEDPDEERAAWTANWTSHDIDIISRFSKLRILTIWGDSLNGRYPVLFNFPLLQKLRIGTRDYLKWDLEMLEGLPSLKELVCADNEHLSGCLSSLRVLKDTLEEVEIYYCPKVGGNFMDLVDFPRLKELDLRATNVTGDIRDLGENDFPALERLFLPKSVYGGYRYQFQNVSDVPSFMHAVHLLLQRSPTMFESNVISNGFFWSLSEDSADWFNWDEESDNPKPPFCLQIVQAGSRRGWSWCNDTSYYDDDNDCYYRDHSCEINWLDPEPDSESSDYGAYVEDLQIMECQIDVFRGYHQPPTEEEHRNLFPHY